MLKRVFDFVFSLLGLIVASPVLVPAAILVYLKDWHSPFYIAPRVSKGGGTFHMIKLRSMVVNADQSGVDSTSSNDKRITTVGKIIRKYKLDELTQMFNVLTGVMSFVGPRPNVKRETDLYTRVEHRLLTVKPGITDLSSIVFSDEGEILKGSKDPDLDYNQKIRPWKSRLGLFYIVNQNFWLDIEIIFLTVLCVFSRKWALVGVQRLLELYGADRALIEVASRQMELKPYPPPGSSVISQSRAVTVGA